MEDDISGDEVNRSSEDGANDGALILKSKLLALSEYDISRGRPPSMIDRCRDSLFLPCRVLETTSGMRYQTHWDIPQHRMRLPAYQVSRPTVRYEKDV